MIRFPMMADNIMRQLSISLIEHCVLHEKHVDYVRFNTETLHTSEHEVAET